MLRPCLLVALLLLSLSAPAATAQVPGLIETPLLASDGSPGDRFGASVATDASTVVVGAPGRSLAAGAVYLFEDGGAGFVEMLTIEASDAAMNDSFGHRLSIDADTLVVGAPGEQDPGFASGAAYVFERDLGGAEQWGERTKLDSSDLAQGDQLGGAVAVDGDTAVVGAHGNADAGANSGAVYVFERDLGGPDAWGESKKLVPSDPIAGHHFGWAVAVDGDTIVVGAYGDADLGFNGGAAYVFQRDAGGPGAWGEVAKLKAPDGVNFDQFGRSVAIHGDSIVAGMFSDDDPFHKSGSAYIFERDLGGADAWGFSAKIQHADAGEQDWFGWSVSVHGDRVVAGARTNATPFVRTGAGYLFRRHHTGPGAWGQAAKIVASDRSEGDQLGEQIAVGSEVIVVGAHSKGPDSTGAAYVYVDDPASLPALGPLGAGALALLLAGSGAVLRYLRIAPNS